MGPCNQTKSFSYALQTSIASGNSERSITSRPIKIPAEAESMFVSNHGRKSVQTVPSLSLI